MKYFRKIIDTLHIVLYSMLSCFSTLVRTFAESKNLFLRRDKTIAIAN